MKRDEEKAFWKAIQEKPSDLDQILVFADWIREFREKNQGVLYYEEHTGYFIPSQYIEHALRYCAFHRIYPYGHSNGILFWYSPSDRVYLADAKERIKHMIPHKRIYSIARRKGQTASTMVVVFRRLALAFLEIDEEIKEREEIMRVTSK